MLNRQIPLPSRILIIRVEHIGQPELKFGYNILQQVELSKVIKEAIKE